MRVFVGMDISEEIRRSIAVLCEEMKNVARGARWIRTEAMHVTLKFIGHAEASRIEKIQSELATVHSARPIEMRFRGAGCFPHARRPRVLWVGIEPSPNLAEISAAIESCLEPLGIPREERTFHPHLTLARFGEPQGQKLLPMALSGLASRVFGAIISNEFHLYQSQLKRGGAEYTRLATFRFCSL